MKTWKKTLGLGIICVVTGLLCVLLEFHRAGIL
jgi:hypothetical protein